MRAVDEEILKLLERRDERGLELLRRQYGGLVSYVVRGICRESRDAEECVSDVWLAVWEKAERFDPRRGSLSGWLTAVARNAALNRLRRRRLEIQALEEGDGAAPSPEEAVLRREDLERLRAVVQSLGREERRLFARKYYYCQSTAQMAAELGLSERAVEGRLYRLRQKLQKRLGGEGR